MASRGWRQFGFWAFLGVCAIVSIYVPMSWAVESNEAAPQSEKPESPKSEKVDLKCDRNVGTVWKVTAKYEVGGHLTVAGEKKARRLPMSVVAQLDYEERVLQNNPRLRSMRHYDNAEATIKVGRGGIQSKLDPKRQQVLVEAIQKPAAAQARIAMSSPAGELSRDELDLVDVVGNSLILADLLPSRPVAVGEYWTHDQETIAALVGLEAVANCDAQSVIGSVDGDRVTLSLAGTIQGASEGTACEIELKANYCFDLEKKHITQFNLAIQEKRPMGHVSPGVDVTAKLTIRIDPLDSPNHLTADVIAGLSEDAKPDSTHLVYEPEDESFRLRHENKWFVTNEGPKQLVLRRVDRGELIAQCNLTQLTKTKPSRHLTLQQFQKDVQFSLGDRFDQFIAAGQRENPAGYREFRVVARGQVKDLPIEWRYYLVADRHGNRVSVVFTVDASLIGQLGEADRDLIAGLTLINQPPKSETAKSETPKNETAQGQLPSAPEPSTQPTAGRPGVGGSVLK